MGQDLGFRRTLGEMQQSVGGSEAGLEITSIAACLNQRLLHLSNRPIMFSSAVVIMKNRGEGKTRTEHGEEW